MINIFGKIRVKLLRLYLVYDNNLIAAVVAFIALAVSLFGLVFCLHVHVNKNSDIVIILNLMLLIPFLIYFLTARRFDVFFLFSMISFIILTGGLILNFVYAKKLVKMKVNNEEIN